MGSAAPPGRRRRWVPVIAVLAVVVAGVVVWQAGGDSSAGGGDDEGAADGWVDSRWENSNRLATDGEIVCGTDLRDNLFCLDVATGDERLALQLPNHVASSPTLVDGTVLVADDGTGEDGLYAYSLDGEQLWSIDAQVRNRELAALHLPVAGDTVAVIDEGLMGSEGDRLVGVDVATGDIRWRAFDSSAEEDPGLSSFTPVLTDGERFYVTIAAPLVYGPDDLQDLDPADPVDAVALDVLQDFPHIDPSDPADRQAAVDEGLIELINQYVSVDHGPVHAVAAIDPASGDELWRAEVAEGPTVFPVTTEVAAFADGSSVAFIVQDSQPGEVVVLDTATGEVRWRVDLTTTDSSVAHLDGVTVVADGPEMRGYHAGGRELWTAPTPVTLGLGNLRVHGGRLFAVDYDVHMVDPTDGASLPVVDGVSGTDVVVAGGLVVVAGISGVEALPMSWIEEEPEGEPAGGEG